MVCATGITTVTTTTRAPVTSTTGEVYFSLDEIINQSEQKVMFSHPLPATCISATIKISHDDFLFFSFVIHFGYSNRNTQLEML